ncbi:MAG TPA: hypothetical protein VK966_11675, partial [Longimicrobiales bacterium]|nr:hypothetical protein [Longimicrobiales bacterium]
RVVVAGSMLELGAGSEALHERSAREIAAADVDLVVGVGLFADAFRSLADEMGDRLILAPDAGAAFDPLAERLRGDEMVLLKGSRGVALEDLMPRLRARFAGDSDNGDGG